MVSSPAMTDLLLYRRRTRAFFLARTTQHMQSLPLARELGRAAACLVALCAWGAVIVVLGG